MLAAVLALSGLTCLAVASVAQHRQGPPPRDPPLSISAPLPALLATRTVPSPLAEPSVSEATRATEVTPGATASSEVAPPAHAPLRPSTPMSLAIPAIGVRTDLLNLGQATDGTLAVPPRARTTTRLAGTASPRHPARWARP